MKKAQIWVETAIYTLIGLAIIGVVLTVATPAIDKYKDEIVIEQTIVVLNDLNSKIQEVKELGAGNRRLIPELRIKEGILEIDYTEDKIVYVLEESRLEYGEAGQEFDEGDIRVKTEKRGRRYDIFLTLSYEDVDLSNGNEKKTLQAAAVPYKLFIENNGTIGNKIQVRIGDIS